MCNSEGPHYTPKRDGLLEGYLKEMKLASADPLFCGKHQYEMLWDSGYLEPNVSVIRLKHVGRFDEHFGVLSKIEIVGFDALKAHAGREGIHDPKDILLDDGSLWEAHNLNPNPKPRE